MSPEWSDKSDAFQKAIFELSMQILVISVSKAWVE